MVTPIELEDLIIAGNAAKVADAVAPLTEAERRKLSSAVNALAGGLWGALPGWKDEDGPGSPGDAIRRLMAHRNAHTGGRHDYLIHTRQSGAARVAVLAVCPLSVCRRRAGGLFLTVDPAVDEAMLRVLRDRRPPFLAELVDAFLEPRTGGLNWACVWGLVREGLIEKPDSDNFIDYFARQRLGTMGIKANETSLPDRLAAEPALLPEVWRLFEVETDAFAFGFERFDHLFQSWPSAIIELSMRGLMDRPRLLRASASAMLNPWKTMSLSTLGKLHEALAPTPDELSVLQPVYADLLASPTPAMAAFGAKMLAAADQAGRLDAAHLPALAGAFSLRTKGPAKAAIKLLKPRAADKAATAEQRDGAAEVLAGALSHEAADVQAAALAALGPAAKLAAKAGDVPPWVQAVRDRLPDLAATVRPKAEALLAPFGLAPPAEPPAGPEVEPADVLSDADDVPAHWRHLAGLDAADLLSGDRYPAPPPFELTDAVVLTGVAPVAPIETVDELIDAVAHAVETVDSPEEVERILDGISRLCDRRPGDFAARTEALLKRAEMIPPTSTMSGITQLYHADDALRRLVLRWLAGPDAAVPESIKSWHDPSMSVFTFEEWRIGELMSRVGRGVAAPLLSAPTHARGWIDPAAAVGRWKSLEASGLTPPRSDVIAALLRLAPDAPDRRAAALQAAKELASPDAAALRYALGSDDPADAPAAFPWHGRPAHEPSQGRPALAAADADAPGKERQGQDAPATVHGRDAHATAGAADAELTGLWLAAGRCRTPRGRLDDLAAAGVVVPGPDGTVPAEYGAKPHKWSDTKSHPGVYSHTYEHLRLDLSRGAAETQGLNAAWPTRLLHHLNHRHLSGGSPVAWARRWAQTIWPLNADPYLATGAEAMVRRLDDAGSTMEPNHAFLDPLFDADRPWTPVAHLAVAVGLAGRDADVRGLCVDALIEAIADGRFDPRPLAAQLATLAAGGLLKLNRPAGALAEVARVSDLHAWASAEVLAGLVGSCRDGLPKDAHHALASLLELLTTLNLPLPPECRPVLEAASGSGKAAKLAGALLALEGTTSAPAIRAARAALAAARLARARRWAGGGLIGRGFYPVSSERFSRRDRKALAAVAESGRMPCRK